MSFDKNKALKLFRVKSSETIKSQIEETKKMVEDFAERNAIRSGTYIKAHTELYKKHLIVKLNILEETIFELIDENYFITNRDEENIVETVNNFVKGECEYKQQNLRSVIASTGLNGSGLASPLVVNIISQFNEERNLKIVYLKHLIEKHNNKANELKKNSSFWNTKNGTITAIGTIILAATSIIAILNSFGVFSNEDHYLYTLPVVKQFDFSVTELKVGNSTNIQWNIENADSISINNGIGRVGFSGTKIIYPLVSTKYNLSAFLQNKILIISKTIVVKDSLGNAL